ncbi:hypothetical protein M2251_005147 [Rhodococcus erythropolis]|nr:hypothetical protein [Rhodococcus erythropolis]
MAEPLCLFRPESIRQQLAQRLEPTARVDKHLTPAVLEKKLSAPAAWHQNRALRVAAREGNQPPAPGGG